MAKSQVPILFWRNETLQQAVSWVERLDPSPEERGAFLGGNATRLMFSSPLAFPGAPALFLSLLRSVPVQFLRQCGLGALPIRQDIAGRLVQAWLDENEEPNLGAFLESWLDPHSATISMTAAVSQSVMQWTGALSRKYTSARSSALVFASSGFRSACNPAPAIVRHGRSILL